MLVTRVQPVSTSRSRCVRRVGDRFPTEGREEAEQALATARELGDPALAMRALTSCGALVNAYDREVAGPFFAEATELARELGDSRSLAQIIALDWMTGRVFLVNNWDDGRGVYFDDPNGHRLEIITRSYGAGVPKLATRTPWWLPRSAKATATAATTSTDE